MIETKINQLLPYITYSLTQSFYQTFVQFDVPKKKSLTPEKLIGISCGSVGVFFIILTIVILVYRKKKEIKLFLNEETFTSSGSGGIVENRKEFNGITMTTDYTNQDKFVDWIFSNI